MNRDKRGKGRPAGEIDTAIRAQRATTDIKRRRNGRVGAKSTRLSENGLRVSPKSRIPPAEGVLPVTIQYPRANL